MTTNNNSEAMNVVVMATSDDEGRTRVNTPKGDVVVCLRFDETDGSLQRLSVQGWNGYDLAGDGQRNRILCGAVAVNLETGVLDFEGACASVPTGKKRRDGSRPRKQSKFTKAEINDLTELVVKMTEVFDTELVESVRAKQEAAKVEWKAQRLAQQERYVISLMKSVEDARLALKASELRLAGALTDLAAQRGE